MSELLDGLIDRIPSGLRRIIIALVTLAILAVLFPLGGGSPPQAVRDTGRTENTQSPSGENQTQGNSGSSLTLAPTSAFSATPRPSATAAPTATACQVRSDWVIFTVRSGDTLAGIAGLAGVTVAELVEANCLANPNRITVNQEIRVPSLPSQFVTATWTPSITPTPRATSTP